MKTLACSLLLVLMVLMSGIANAKVINDTTLTRVIPNSVKLAITSKIDYPDFAKEQKIEGVVTASFKIDSNGMIAINQINGHPELVKYINNQLATLVLPVSSADTNNFIIRFRFKIN